MARVGRVFGEQLSDERFERDVGHGVPPFRNWARAGSRAVIDEQGRCRAFSQLKLAARPAARVETVGEPPPMSRPSPPT
jgi:hypothetical protein